MNTNEEFIATLEKYAKYTFLGCMIVSFLIGFVAGCVCVQLL
jgi:hypothetical protein